MDLEAIKRLLRSPRPSDEYLAGVKGFLDFAYMGKKQIPRFIAHVLNVSIGFY
jgi:hypothetical protein